ncbi:Mini-ribonuclease 3 [Paenibacillus assamensis]|uniref:Mini-ribonuclease 3 n=1 Tax=Paenibacillus assamensis TaxID=311244 RepID=UPI001FDF765E|nr:ribonuclease III domain-containing protein [Paenibacillus assamensis]
MKGVQLTMVDEQQQQERQLGQVEAGQLDWLFPYRPSKDTKQLNPIVLAYIGDAVYEMAVRQYVISQANHRPNHMHRESIKLVSAKAQARNLQKLVPFLSEEEADVVRQGRNTKSNVPKSANVNEYRQATALEALFGFLYYEKRVERLRELVELMMSEEDGSVKEPAVVLDDSK